MKKSVVLQAGQVGLIVLLIMTVVLTIGVSVATRSVTQTKTARQEQESTEALNQAEAGIEELLAMDTLTAGNHSTDTLTRIVENVNSYNRRLQIGEVAEITLNPDDTGVPAAGTFTLTWVDTGACPDRAAVVVALFNTAGTVTRTAYDACDDSPNRATVNGNGFTYESTGQVNITYTATDTLARIRVAYAPTNITVVGDPPNTLPVQGQLITAQATNTDVARAVSVFRPNPSLPNIFDYALFAGSGAISK